MNTFRLGALALSLILAGCATNGSTGSSSSAGSALGSVLGAAGSGGTGSSTESKIGAAADVFKAVTVSDDELKSVSQQFRAYEERTEKVAPAKNKYAQRLARLTKKHVNEDGMKLNFKVYLANEVNADATADGSIRVYSGLMDMMNDQELLGVIGHEIGHVKLQHSLAAMRTAYLASAGRKAASAAGGVGRPRRQRPGRAGREACQQPVLAEPGDGRRRLRPGLHEEAQVQGERDGIGLPQAGGPERRQGRRARRDAVVPSGPGRPRRPHARHGFQVRVRGKPPGGHPAPGGFPTEAGRGVG